MKTIDQHLIELCEAAETEANVFSDMLMHEGFFRGIAKRNGDFWAVFEVYENGDGALDECRIQAIFDLAKALGREPMYPEPDTGKILTVEAVNKERQEAVLSDGQVIPVVSWIGADLKTGETCEVAPLMAVAATAGPDKDGGWYAINLDEYGNEAIQ